MIAATSCYVSEPDTIDFERIRLIHIFKFGHCELDRVA